MKQNRRRLRRTTDKRRSAFFASPEVAGKRVLRTEQLESRHLMAGDLLSPYHNAMTPTDVNNDGYVAPIDALMVINELNSRGSYDLLNRQAAAGGEGEGSSQTKYYDTNNDGYLTPLDALVVINALNAEGEGETDIVRYYIIPYQLGTNTPLTTIEENQDFELRILVDDVRPLSDPGVYAGFLDIITDTSKLDVYVNEIQHINIIGNPTGGTFTLTFNGQTTAPITYTQSPNPANSIDAALEALPAIGANNVEVVREAGNRFRVKFVNALGDTDVSALTVNANLTGGTSPTATITQTAQGTQNDPVAFRNAFLPADTPDVEYSFGDQATADLQTGRWNDIGSVSDSLELPDTNAPLELARVRLKATDAGTITFTGDVVNVLTPAHQTLVFANATNPNDRSDVPPGNIGIYRSLPTAPLDSAPAFVVVTEPISAVNDPAITTPEETAINIPVLANDTTTAGGVIRITAIDTTGTAGTAVQVDPNNTPTNQSDNQIRFTPAANFVGTTTFRYEIGDGRGNREWATVTVNVTGVNDAPVITLPGTAPAATEDTQLIINGLSVADVDAGSGNLQVTLTAATPRPTDGVLTLGTTAGLDNVIGNGTDAVVSFQGTIAEINAALSGLRWLPPADFNGSATITVEVSDLGNSPTGPLTDIEVLTIAVGPQNDAPVNVAPVTVLSVVEGDTLIFAAGDLSISDPDAAETANASLTTTLTAQWGTFTVTETGHGAQVTGDGTGTLVLQGTIAQINAALVNLNYTPVVDSALETDSVTMVTNDNGNTGPVAQSTTSTITIEITTGTLPRARRDVETVAEDTVDYVIDVLGNDLTNSYEDPLNPGQFLNEQPILTGVTQPVVQGTSDPAGSVSINDNGTPEQTDDFVEFTPTLNFVGTATFTYTMNETDDEGNGIGADVTGTVTVTVTPVNDAPTADDDSTTTNEDTAVVVNVLDGDADVDGDTLTPVIVNQPAVGTGTATVNANGTITYTPASNFNGTATFTYRVNDGSADSNVATVTITVNPVNDAPVAVTNSYTATEDTTLTVDAVAGVLTNDTDVENSPLSAALVSQASKGTVTLNSDGSFTYVPNANATGADTFTYKANDGALDSDTVIVTINITAVNDVPDAVDDLTYTTNEDTALVITTRASGVLGNDTDVESQSTLTAVQVTGPANGSLTLNANGSFTYTPNANFNGTDSFTYKANDGSADSNTATVMITVNAVNDAPVAVADSYTGANEDAVYSSSASVLNNDTDVDSGDTKTAVAGTFQSAKGATVILLADGSFTYDPRTVAAIQALPLNGSTTDTFTYTVRDSANAASTATVTITIGGRNDAPDAVNDAFGAIANVPQTYNVLANDTDVDTGDTRTIQSVTQPTVPGATVTFDANGNVTYTAPAGTSGPDTFTYTIVDSNGATDTATVNVSVQNFVPTDISGYVYIDKTTTAQPGGNGQLEAGERGVANVTLVLSSPTGKDMFGNTFTPMTAVTDANGRYVFAQVVPGNYVITQVQPEHLRDGLETVTDTQYASVQASQNNQIFISLPQLGAASGKVENNNFAELGVDASSLDNSAGLMQEMLASSTQNGLVLSTNLTGSDFWFYALNNWTGLSKVDVTLSSNLATLTIKATVNGVERTATISQQNMPGRFRVLGYTDEGGYIIRIDGKYSDFNWVAVQQPQGEGEAAGDADASYVNSVDQVLAEQSWA